MNRFISPFVLVVLSLLLGVTSTSATCTIGGHNETSENFAAGGWTAANMTPGVVLGAPSGTHLVFTEVAARGCGTGALSDSSEFVEIYNPTTRPISLDDKYIADDLAYYRVVNGAYLAASASDFTLKFPLGLTLLPGRVLVLCVTKTGFAGSGASAAGAQFFLEMKDSNANPADDMIQITTNSVFPLSGGMLTNPSTTNGEWCVLFCWDGASDLVCDIDYASWGANSASNPKMDKTGVSIDGPDAGAIASSFLADIAAATQTNLGTALTKPNTFQRVGSEVGEIAAGGNGCVGRVVPTVISWSPVASVEGGTNIRFQVRWSNTDDDAMSPPVSGNMMSQEFGVFLPDYGSIGSFNVPPMQPNSFFDVFFDVPLANLPAPPQKIVGGGGGGGGIASRTASYGGGATINNDCPPDTNWAGNVDIVWSGNGQSGSVNRHYADLLTCIGGAPSYIHFRGSNCPSPMPWTVTGLCPGFSATLVNEDYSPAPNPVPVGWTGWIQVSASAAVPTGTPCCFGIVFGCDGATSTIEICTTACDCTPNAPTPTLTQVDWVPAGSGVIRFHQRWENPNGAAPSEPVAGSMMSQEFGVFLPNHGPIGSFNVPPIAPNSFFDIFFDIPLVDLPAPPQKIIPTGGAPNLNHTALASRPGGGATINNDCPPDTNWAGNVDIMWTGSASGLSGQVNRHYADLLTCKGGAPSYIHFRGSNCPSPMPWTITGLCPGFSAALVNEDFSPAPNPVPVGWTGWIQVSASAAVPTGTLCCFGIVFGCDGATSTIEICTTACDCSPNKPTLTQNDWSMVGTAVRFHLRWENLGNSSPSLPISGDMTSQRFGVFMPTFGPIGHFDVPPIQPASFFDVFFDVPLTALPPEPARQGGPPTGVQCFPNLWHGNVNVDWTGPGGTGSVGRHFDEVPVCAGGDSTYLFLETDCPDAAGASWSISGLCPGFSATLVNLDHTPAPNPLPAGWIGYIRVSATAATPVGTLCCFTVNFLCGTVPATIDVCAKTCPCPRRPVLKNTDWTRMGSNIRFHMQWSNPDTGGDTEPVSGGMNSQSFGAFLPDFSPIGQFTVPPLAPDSFFDVFFDVPLTALPPEPQKVLPNGGPPANSPCPQDTSWSGNVDIQWDGSSGSSAVNRHFTSLLVRPGSGSSHVHTLIFCTEAAGATWAISGLCPGWSATLLNENFTPAPNPVPAGWTGWISVAAGAGVPAGSSCCFTVTFWCAGVPGVIDVCAEACLWPTSSVLPDARGVEFGVYATAPNPTRGAMLIGFAMPRSGDAQLDIYDLAGHRVRNLLDGPASAGMNAVRWDGRADRGDELAPGTYFVRLKAGERVSSKRIVLIR